MAGEIVDIHDLGSIVLVRLSDGVQAPFDRRCWLDFCTSYAEPPCDGGPCQGVHPPHLVDLRGKRFEYDADAGVLAEV